MILVSLASFGDKSSGGSIPPLILTILSNSKEMLVACTHFDFNFLGLLWTGEVVLFEVESGDSSVHRVPNDIEVHRLYGAHTENTKFY